MIKKLLNFMSQGRVRDWGTQTIKPFISLIHPDTYYTDKHLSLCIILL